MRLGAACDGVLDGGWSGRRFRRLPGGEDAVLFRPEAVPGQGWLATHASAGGTLEWWPSAVAVAGTGRLDRGGRRRCLRPGRGGGRFQSRSAPFDPDTDLAV